jgi:hypothetical protein
VRTFWTILLVTIAILALIDGGKYLGIAILAVLAPVYGWLLASVFFIGFLITAAIAVFIRNHVREREAVELEKTAQARRAA